MMLTIVVAVVAFSAAALGVVAGALIALRLVSALLTKPGGP